MRICKRAPAKEINEKIDNFVTLAINNKYVMSHQSVYEVWDDQVIIKLPTEFKNSRKVRVTIDDVIESTDEKLLLLKRASTDPLFLADVQEVERDFQLSDKEVL